MTEHDKNNTSSGISTLLHKKKRSKEGSYFTFWLLEGGLFKGNTYLKGHTNERIYGKSINITGLTLPTGRPVGYLKVDQGIELVF